jgi:hypothetical protein
MSYAAIITQDGTCIVRCLVTGRIATGRTIDDTLAELRRLTCGKVAA